MRNGNRFVGPAIALVTGAVALVAHRESPGLVEPHGCPGLLEWIGAAAARHASGSPVGPWLLNADRVLVVAAVAVFASAAFTTTRSWVAAISAGLAFGVQPMLSPSFGVFGAAPAIVAALLANARRPAAVLALVVAGALIDPPAALPLVAIVIWWMWRTALPRRTVWVVSAAAVAIGGAWLLARPTASCWLPVPRGPFAASLRDAVSQSLAAPTMFALALAALGAFARRGRAIAALLLVYSIATLLTALGDPNNIDRAVLPVTVALWLIVAAGLTELLTTARRAASRAAALALAMLLPVLQLPRLRAATQDFVRPAGHDTMTPASLHHLIELLPDRSTLVSEDAIVDLLLRAEHQSWDRMGKHLSLVARDEAAVGRAVRESPDVLAFPRAQTALQLLGFRTADRLLGDVSGLADVSLVSPCAAIPRTWQAMPTLNASRVLSIVAASDRDRGPFVLYLATDARPAPIPRDWSEGVSQGYNVSTFQVGTDDGRVADALKDDGFSSADFATARYVVRFEIRRVPGAPRMLSIDLGESPSVAYARTWPEAADHHLLLCPAFPHSPAPIGIR